MPDSSRLDADAAWHRLRDAVEMTAHHPSLILLMCDSADDAAQLRERTEHLATRLSWPFMCLPPDDLADWAMAQLPYDGIAWVPLAGEPDRVVIACLHTLNHLRTRLALPGAGCVILSGDGRLGSMAVREAADLWSVRSLAMDVAMPGEEFGTRLAEGLAASRASHRAVGPSLRGWREGRWTPPSVTVPPEYQAPGLDRLIGVLNQVYAALPDDVATAEQALGQARLLAADGAGEAPGALLGLATMCVGAAAEDPAAVTGGARDALRAAMMLESGAFRLQVLTAVAAVARPFGCDVNVEAQVADAALATATDLFDRAGSREQDRAAAGLSAARDLVADVTARTHPANVDHLGMELFDMPFPPAPRDDDPLEVYLDQGLGFPSPAVSVRVGLESTVPIPAAGRSFVTQGLGLTTHLTVSDYEQMLADSERTLGTDHPDTLTLRANLAHACRTAGDLGRAIPLYEATLADRERILGPEHPDTLLVRNDLAVAYLAAGDLARAIELYEATLADCERILGPEHPTTRLVRDNVNVALAVRTAVDP